MSNIKPIVKTIKEPKLKEIKKHPFKHGEKSKEADIKEENIKEEDKE